MSIYQGSFVTRLLKSTLKKCWKIHKKYLTTWEGKAYRRNDTAADCVLVVICLIKLIPVIHVPTWLIIWIIVIAVIKVINLISGYVMRKEMVALHTVMNKVTGILLFVLPLTLTVIDLKYSGVFVSAAATFAAIQEGHLIRAGKGNNDPANR